jgi:NADPH-dependent glutamate synthase beta subunit-like oxidoreductase/NAD(P)H-flavin reductase
VTERALHQRDGARWPRLGIPGFSYPDLHDPLRLAELTRAFDRELHAADPELFARFESHRRRPLSGPAEGDLLVEVSAHLSRFVGRLFGVEQRQSQLRAAAGRDAPLFRVKREFVQRRVFKKGAAARPGADEFPALDDEVESLLAAAAARDPRVSMAAGDPELVLALVVDTLLDAARAPDAFRALCEAMGRGLADRGEQPERARELLEGAPVLDERLLDLLDRWCYAATLHPQGRHRTHGWSLLRLPRAMDFQHLVPLRRGKPYEIAGLEEHQRRRDGFRLTDPRATPREARSEIDYCIYCHGREKDSCSKGFPEKGTGRYRKNPLGIPLTGCPLEERISEMHLAAREGDMVSALALVCIDNPMAPGTGHRICNDCMKACVYQKQDPVHIPQIETRVLTDVLGLPWGYEIWSLLTRWNPLRIGRPHPRPYSGLDVLVVGMGPAGYTLAHHLLNEGFGVVAVDGLKIEPLEADLVSCARAVGDCDAQFGAPLDQRVLSGFGGVSEYGITVRWDKSFLDVLHLNLARRRNFKLYGGTRFGGTITLDDAWALGFRHVALAAGAGRPTIIGLKNNLLRGVRKASDFLMALQLTGAFKDDALANLQVRLPAVVIGGGLTAIDAATELKAYYPAQVEKLLDRHEALCQSGGEEMVFSVLDPEERHVYAELLEHGRAVRAERERAEGAGEKPDFTRLVAQWGGVTIAYRKGLHDSPAYRLNHEEVVKCLEEGIVIAEGLSPVEAVPDAHGAVKAVRFALHQQVDGKWRDAGETVELPARTVCIAAGTGPNVTLEKESPGTLALDPEHGSFRPHRLEGGKLVPADVTDDLSGEPGFFTSYAKDGRLVSFFGDNHPDYAGSVVKAMASAKDGAPQVANLFAEELARTDGAVESGAYDARSAQARWHALTARLDDELCATVHQVQRLTPTIVEVVVRAKAAARHFQPGQFYRLQNYESLCVQVDGTKLLMEGLALTGAWVDRERGLLSLIVLEMGSSSRLCALLRPGEPVVVMGPTGAPSTIPRGEDVVLCGGGLGNAVLFSISRALRANRCRVVYFAGYKHAHDVFKRDEIEEATDVVVWSSDAGRPPQPRRPQDRAFQGNIVQAMVAYATGKLGEPAIPFANVRRVIAIGSDRMMAAVARARHEALAPLLPQDHAAIASINSPMQCMMKEICAQCLQKHRDPRTGKESIVFTCFDQDQPMDQVDWENLRARLRTNSLQEKLGALWLDRLLSRSALRRDLKCLVEPERVARPNATRATPARRPAAGASPSRPRRGRRRTR